MFHCAGQDLRVKDGTSPPGDPAPGDLQDPTDATGHRHEAGATRSMNLEKQEGFLALSRQKFKKI